MREDQNGWTTKVTALGDGKYGCRVFHDGVLHSEAVAENKQSVSATIKELLRWVDKTGGDSPMAAASRDREPKWVDNIFIGAKSPHGRPPRGLNMRYK